MIDESDDEPYDSEDESSFKCSLRQVLTIVVSLCPCVESHWQLLGTGCGSGRQNSIGSLSGSGVSEDRTGTLGVFLCASACEFSGCSSG